MSNVYINRALRKDIPSDAILISEQDVLQMQWKVIKEWVPKSDIWPFTYGVGLLTALNGATTITFVNHYRRKLNLGNYGRISMVLPTGVLPVLFSALAHYSLISSAVILNKDCPLCIQTRAAAYQIGCGVVYPVVATPIAGFYYALTYGTCKIPKLSLQTVPELFKLWVSMTRKLKMTLPIAIAINGFAASILTYFEAKSFFHVQSVIYEKEENFRRLISEGVASE